MSRTTKPSCPWYQSGVITEALVRIEIAYLDSVTNYREFLPAIAGNQRRRFSFTLVRKKLVKCAALARGAAAEIVAWLFP